MMPQIAESSMGELRWQAVPEYRDLLLGPQGLQLDTWLHSGAAQIVKHGPHRTVYRVDLPGLSFYVKYYRLADTRAWLRELVRPSKARMEHDRALSIAARGVPTITPLALGEAAGWGPGESALITLALDQTEPLSHFLETTLAGFDLPRQVRVRQMIARALGTLLARMHDAGIRHNDLHPGNILVHLADDDQPNLFLIDLHGVHIGAPLDWNASRANLVTLNRWFAMRSQRADRLRFWHSYCRHRVGNDAASNIHPFSSSNNHPVLFPKHAKDIEVRTRASNLAFWRTRDRRCLKTNRYYQRIRTATIVGFGVADLDHVALHELINDPDEPFRRPGATLLKNSRSATVVEFDLAEGQKKRRVIYKRFRVTSPADPWKAMLRRSPALRSWANGQGMRERCLPTPRPLAVFHRRSHGLILEGYLLIEQVPTATYLVRYVAGLNAMGGRKHPLRQRIEHLARLVAVMHERGVWHRDLKASNVLVSSSNASVPSTKDDFGPFCLIDLAGAILGDFLTRKRREQDLARLHASFHRNPVVTRTDKLRFLRNYLRRGCLVWRRADWKVAWKSWWRTIERATQGKIARNLRNGRPLA